MLDTDPSQTLFGGDRELDLYATLSIESRATSDEIKTAYKKLALRYHPDKLLSTKNHECSEKEKEEVNLKFQQIGFAYKVLSDPKRRKRWDETGRTDENFLDESDQATWTEYFKDLWSGEVNSNTIEEFTKNYQGSKEELEDLQRYYLEFDGSLAEILSNTMCSTLEDEPRLIKRIDELIKKGTLPVKKRWEKEKKDDKARSKRKQEAKKEAKEAEELAKELGVHDKLFENSTNQEGSSSSTKKKKGKSKEEDSEENLRALIQSRSSGRFESLISKLEAQAQSETNQEDRKSKSKRRKLNDKDEMMEEPSEEEFLKIQAEIENRKKKMKNKTGEKSSDVDIKNKSRKKK